MPETLAFGPEDFQNAANVSRETLALIEQFDQLFLEWTGRLNLVAKSTVPDRWNRHYLDSAQLLPLISVEAKKIIDFGSGAGFPGLLLAILCHHHPDRQHQHFYLVESITKKCAFLREVATELGLKNVTVLNQRIEEVRVPKKAEVITARALADLDKLLGYGQRFLHKNSICLFLKGEKAQEEVISAATRWKMEVAEHPSKTHKAATILEIRNLSRV